MRYFLVDQDNIIVNVILWDGVEPYDPAPYRMLPFVEVGELGLPYPA